jgi:hypothetical protein
MKEEDLQKIPVQCEKLFCLTEIKLKKKPTIYQLRSYLHGSQTVLGVSLKV